MTANSLVRWDMYDPRMTLKKVAGENIDRGDSIFIHSDGLAYVTDDDENALFHGCALKDVLSGEVVTIVTHGRLYVATTETIGGKAMVFTGGGSGVGGPPGTGAGGTAVAGFAVGANLIFVHVGTGADT